jgi:hypothetical protein
VELARLGVAEERAEFLDEPPVLDDSLAFEPARDVALSFGSQESAVPAGSQERA